MVTHFIYALQIAIGTFFAISIAGIIGLDFTNSAGIITLLTIVTSKWDTLKLAAIRILSFFVSTFLAWVIFRYVSETLIAYAIFIFLLVAISSNFGWRNTISVNAVIGNHFLTTHNFGLGAIWNEFLLLMIGVSVSIFIHLFHNNKNKKESLMRDVKEIENRMSAILCRMSDVLLQKDNSQQLINDLLYIEKLMEQSLQIAYEYQGSTFVSAPLYYIRYIKMRTKQCAILRTFCEEMEILQNAPKQASQIAEFLVSVSEHVDDWSKPYLQRTMLLQLQENLKEEELPKTHKDLECRMILHHVIGELEDLLRFKQEFVERKVRCRGY